jgi:non-ribosomal peptide synthetase component F
VGAFEYNTALFEAPTIARLAGHFQALLEGIVADAGQPLARLPLLAPAEHRQIVEEWNATDVAYRLERGVHELIEAQAQRRPQALALVAGTTTLTYRELTARANQLAHHLPRP